VQLNFGFDAISSALQGVSVDTQSVLPEPCALSLLGCGALLLARRRR
jgi:hypothetical protein